jgi:mannosyl-oligosaccharide alpha-1,2-mannosidase
VVLAEIGSLSLEFTRLAQITGEQKYYDAVARITDNLEEFQDNTRLPGMWPAEFDASGCKVIKDDPDESISLSSTLDNSVESPLGAESEPVETTAVSLPPNGKKYKPLDLPSPVVLVAETTASEPPATDSAKFKPLDLPDPVVLIAKTTAEEPAATSVLSRPVERKKRQLDDLEVDEDDVPTTVEVSFSVPPLPSPTGPECEEQGFASSPGTHAEEYTLGGMSDSTYEYLPKEWLLLGGLVPKYRTMYEKSIEVVKKNLLFRPMLPNDTNVLFSGKLIMPRPDIGHPHLEPENAHLTCFAGGMFGMGAKIFDRPGDLEIAKKLTEGCIWSYDMTATGIMPEAFLTVACRSIERCEWNETKYWDEIDPSAQWRFSSYETQIKLYKDQMASASDWYSKQLAAMTAAPTTTAARGSVEARATGSSSASTSPRVEAELESGFQKRQLDQADIEDSEPVLKPQPPNVPGWNAPGQKAPQDAGLVVDSSEPPTPVQVWPYNDADSALEPDSTTPEFPYIYSPTPPMTHEEYVKATIENERLPPGVTSVKAKGYILR